MSNQQAKNLSEADEKVIDAILNFANAIEAAAVDTKHRIAEIVGVEVQSAPKPEISEAVFNARKYRAAKGERLSDYEICFREDNNADDFNYCFNILRSNNATIKNHFSEPSWTHYYWIYLEKYQDRFYRKTKNQ